MLQNNINREKEYKMNSFKLIIIYKQSFTKKLQFNKESYCRISTKCRLKSIYSINDIIIFQVQ